MRTAIVIVLVVMGIAATIPLGRFVSSLRASATQATNMKTAYIADPNNSVTVAVRGWSRTELDRIVADFLKSYDLPEKSFVRIVENPHDAFVLAFPQDIEPKLLFFLVNYINYPRNFDLAKKRIGAVAHVVLTRAYGAPGSTLVGQRAIVYVPSNDTEYDLVYIKSESGKVFEIPFTSLIWRPVEDARMPDSVRNL